MGKIPFSDRVKYLFFPPKCVCCGEILTDPGYSRVFCRGCLTKIVGESSASCTKCGKPYTRCVCAPVGFLPSALIYAFPYSGAMPETRKVILSCKNAKRKDIFDYIARQLLLKSFYVFPLEGEYKVTFVPRSRKKELERNVDQARELAKSVSRLGGFELYEMFSRSGGTEQKMLDREQRAINASAAYSLRDGREKDADGGRFILVDDVVTTGATANACADLLYRAGAREVICFSASKRDKRTEPVI